VRHKRPDELLLKLVRELAKKAAREDHERALKQRNGPRKRVLKPKEIVKNSK
jgi:hypothetical protein